MKVGDFQEHLDLDVDWKSLNTPLFKGIRLEAIEASMVDGTGNHLAFATRRRQDAVPMYVMGVNHENYKSSDTVVRPWECGNSDPAKGANLVTAKASKAWGLVL